MITFSQLRGIRGGCASGPIAHGGLFRGLPLWSQALPKDGRGLRRPCLAWDHPAQEAPVATPWSEKPGNLTIHLRVQRVMV